MDIKKANDEIAKIIAYVEEHQDALGYMNLKYYDAFFYRGSNEFENDFPNIAELSADNIMDLFHEFCEEQYYDAKEWLKEMGIDFEQLRNNIGRTSSFYLHDRSVFNVYGMDRLFRIDHLVYDYCGADIEQFLIGDFIKKEPTEDCEDIIEFICNDAFEYVKKMLEPIIETYGVITTYKNNQVESFKWFLEDIEDNLIDEKEEQQSKQNELERITNKCKEVLTDDEFNMLKGAIIC